MSCPNTCVRIPRYFSGRFTRISMTIEVKYIPMIREKNTTMELLETLLSQRSLTFCSVTRNPRMDVIIISPTNKNEMCCNQKVTSTSTFMLCSSSCKDRLTGSIRATRFKAILMVAISTLYTQYTEKKHPSKKYKRPFKVLENSMSSLAATKSSNSMYSRVLTFSNAAISSCSLQMRSWSSSREVSRRRRDPKMDETDHAVGEVAESRFRLFNSHCARANRFFFVAMLSMSCCWRHSMWAVSVDWPRFEK
mmetsp:Transcript_57612/g.102935  ORF Transcript_57612/g.102935 Transcript_57612/m.102935 type:complete len:250 (+) Transcript_57612:32-781(+)